VTYEICSVLVQRTTLATSTDHRPTVSRLLLASGFECLDIEALISATVAAFTPANGMVKVAMLLYLGNPGKHAWRLTLEAYHVCYRCEVALKV